MSNSMSRLSLLLSACLLALLVWTPSPSRAETAVPAAETAPSRGLTIRQLNTLREVAEIAVSPNGDLVAYTLEVPRTPGVGEDGPANHELHVLDLTTGTSRGFIVGDVNINDIAFTSDGQLITYGAARFGAGPALWAIPVAGGESRKLVEREGLEGYGLSPAGEQVALFITPEDKERTAARKQGFDREVFEEEWQARQLWIAPLPAFTTPPTTPEEPAAKKAADADEKVEEKAEKAEKAEKTPEPAETAEDSGEEAADPKDGRQIELDGSVSEVEWSADGRLLVAAVQPRSLVDDAVMFRRLRVLDVASGKVVTAIANPGKLSQFALSPNGSHVAFISGADLNDPREGRLMVAAVAREGEASGEQTEVSGRDLMPDYQAHVTSFTWRDGETLLWVAAEGSEATFGSVDLEGHVERLARSNEELGVPILGDLEVTLDGKVIASGHSPSHPHELFILEPGGCPKRLTNSNPWLDDIELAHQEVISWTASDGVEIEGILVHPLDGRKPAPLLLMVHGGPESNDWNGWISGYSRPAQVAAARGYAVLFPNYRGSTGRGVEFAKSSQGDAAGAEFRDLVEGVDHLASIGVADPERVGITGGSYGGYATAWGSTFYTDRFKAGVMFVGISNKLSKGFTSDIPQEDVLVHTRYDPWTKWQFSLERSPLYYAEKSKTPLLIAGGTADTRVHPSQSLQLYRALKMMGKTVRYVRYPGEMHGNRRAASRDDYTRRLMRWMDHFVVEGKTDLPPVDLD